MKPNRLINEKSPYLRQHAYNPVDWYPWAEEAFKKAQAEDKPIFLSIGYSTCHWCHVMEKESFEDKDIAGILNKHFVSIKVDREERPDIDNVYMKVCYFFNERGGWPLTIIMTPDKKPFFADTYIPKDDKYGRIGLKRLLLRIIDLWNNERTKVLEISEGITDALKSLRQEKEHFKLSEDIIHRAYDELREHFDHTFGGFGSEPKFPVPVNLMFLNRYYYRTKNNEALSLVLKTLDSMRRGGIYDHIGGGFHRYSTDRQWILPHFEKMLYDNALLMIAYTEAYNITKNDFYKKVVEEIATYLKREMLSDLGAFYSAEDADSEGKEGEFYLWSYDELKTILNEEEFSIANLAFNLSKEGNFIEEALRRRIGKNIIYLSMDTSKIAERLNISPEQVEKLINQIKSKLFAQRERRTKPLRDDKILTDWNALVALAFTRAYLAFENVEFGVLAKGCLDFLLNNMFDKEGRLLHRYKDGEASIFGFLEDYAFLIWALTDFYFCSFDTNYLKATLRLTDHTISHFWDNRNGGFYQTADYAETVILRNKEVYDGAVPSGNSVMAYNLIRLSRLLEKKEYEDLALSLFKAFSRDLERYPSSHLFSLIALDLIINGTSELTVVPIDRDEEISFLKNLQKEFIPNLLLIIRDAETEILIPSLREKGIINKKATYYICKNFHCQEPTNSREQIRTLIL